MDLSVDSTLFYRPQVPPQMEPVNPMMDPRRTFCSLQPQPVTSYIPAENESASIIEMRNNYDRYEASPPR